MPHDLTARMATVETILNPQLLEKLTYELYNYDLDLMHDDENVCNNGNDVQAYYDIEIEEGSDYEFEFDSSELWYL